LEHTFSELAHLGIGTGIDLEDIVGDDIQILA